MLMIPPRRKRNLLERYKATREKYQRLKDTVYKGNLVLLKLRGLFTSEDARVTNTFLQFLVVLAALLIIVPGYILQLILVAHVFTSKMAFRQPMKKKIIEFIKLVWESIPHSPLVRQHTTVLSFLYSCQPYLTIVLTRIDQARWRAPPVATDDQLRRRRWVDYISSAA